MMIDEKGRLFKKVSIIDLFVIIVLVLVGAIGILKFGNSSVSGHRGEEQAIQMKFYAEAVEEFTVDAIFVGDKVVKEANNEYLGLITAIDIDESVEFGISSQGEVVKSSKEGYYAMEITTQGTGKIYDGSVLINGNLYSTGSEIIIRAGKGKLFLKISEVSAVA